MTDLEPYYFKGDQQVICGEIVPSIEDDFDENYPSIVDRFFTRYYYDFSDQQTEPHQVLYHSNRICLIGLAPGHDAFARGIESITFDVGKIDRSQNRVKGKKKSGGMIVQMDSSLALVTCKDGRVFKVRSCVPGKLVEVNQRVVEDVSLLEKEGEGYIAIVMPKPEQCEAIKNKLMSREQFESKNGNVIE
ncbi:protein Abitram [Topomyia yanbarensis]|uniref:protein Abitram n=1 Tax=Topomyia yanbarensis TaxID=2498891 RepID=UPI00273C30B2|nr:protein Abitram [Topomyia yanbarensis]